jgi:hypothetical protein
MTSLARNRDPLEIHVPISPTPNFITRVRYLAASLRSSGGTLREARIIVTIGADEEPTSFRNATRWARHYPIEWRWLPQDLFHKHGYFATALERFRYEFLAPTVLMLDADVIVSSNFEDLLVRVGEEPALFGLVAHATPFSPLREKCTDAEWWQAVFDAAGLGNVESEFRHTLWNLDGHPTSEWCPPYFNFGVLMAPSEIMTAIGKVIYTEMAHVERVVDFEFKCQIALTLALVRLGLPYRTLPLRYNFPNLQVIADAFPQELADVRLLHYLGKSSYFDKDRDFESSGRVASWLSGTSPDLEVDARLQDACLRAHALVLREDENGIAVPSPEVEPTIDNPIRILVACSMKSGSTYVAKVLAAYFGCDRVYPLAYWGRCEQNLVPEKLEAYRSRSVAVQMHIRPYEPNVDAIRQWGFQVVYLWRNLGDVIISLDDHIRIEDHRNPVCYIDDRESYLHLPVQHRYRYLIRHAIPWYVAFYLSWRRHLDGVSLIRASYENLVADRDLFFATIINSMGEELDVVKLKSSLAASTGNTRFNQGLVGRSDQLLSAGNKAQLEKVLLDHPQDLSELWAELPWRRDEIRESCTSPLPDHSILADVARCPHHTEAGVLISLQPYIRIEVTAEDWFFLVPRALLAPDGKDYIIKLIVRGDVGSCFSLYWRAADESFGEVRSIHVACDVNSIPRTVTFSLAAVPAEAVEFRLDCFNGIQRPGVGEILEIARLEAEAS